MEIFKDIWKEREKYKESYVVITYINYQLIAVFSSIFLLYCTPHPTDYIEIIPRHQFHVKYFSMYS